MKINIHVSIATTLLPRYDHNLLCNTIRSIIEVGSNAWVKFLLSKERVLTAALNYLCSNPIRQNISLSNLGRPLIQPNFPCCSPDFLVWRLQIWIQLQEWAMTLRHHWKHGKVKVVDVGHLRCLRLPLPSFFHKSLSQMCGMFHQHEVPHCHLEGQVSAKSENFGSLYVPLSKPVTLQSTR